MALDFSTTILLSSHNDSLYHAQVPIYACYRVLSMFWHGARLFSYHPTTIPPRSHNHTQVPIYACYSVLSMLWHGALALDSVR